MDHLRTWPMLPEGLLTERAGFPPPEDTDAVNPGSQQKFDALMPRVVQRVLGDGPDADEALRTGGFVINEAVVVMRLNPDHDSLEFFCDIGQPLPHALLDTYRVALELNLCRAYPNVTFGLHPESGRLVATCAMHMLLVADDEICLQTLNTLTELASTLREQRVFQVEA